MCACLLANCCRGLLEMIDFERRVIPTFGLDGVVMGEMARRQIQAFLTAGGSETRVALFLKASVYPSSFFDSVILFSRAGKTHKFLSTHWGFTQSKGANVSTAGGSICLLSGAAGSGKTATAHAIAFELGQPIKVVWYSTLLKIYVRAIQALHFPSM